MHTSVFRYFVHAVQFPISFRLRPSVRAGPAWRRSNEQRCARQVCLPARFLARTDGSPRDPAKARAVFIACGQQQPADYAVQSAAAQAQVNEAHSSPRCARPPLQLYASALPLTSFSPAHDSAPSPSFIRSTRRARVPSVWGRCERASQPSSTSKYLALYDQPCTVAGQYTATRTLKSAVRDLIDGHASLAPILSAPS